ncbi:MAG: hypothetical protein MUE33_00615 [Cytophagaceae bacterium]|jgi:hypothetical protein|nr:hypothetical protein [Cytophagaceae bacterium]
MKSNLKYFIVVIIAIGLLLYFDIIKFEKSKPTLTEDSTYLYPVSSIRSIRHKMFIDSVKTGDIVFYNGLRDEQKMVPEHVLEAQRKLWGAGLVIRREDDVYIAVIDQIVQMVPLRNWLRRMESVEGLVVKRIKDDTIFEQDSLRNAFIEFIATHAVVNTSGYTGQRQTVKSKMIKDEVLLWSDKNWYEAEMIWKVYERVVGVQLCPTKKMKDIKWLKIEIVRSFSRNHLFFKDYENETIVDAQDIYHSVELKKVYDTNGIQEYDIIPPGVKTEMEKLK